MSGWHESETWPGASRPPGPGPAGSGRPPGAARPAAWSSGPDGVRTAILGVCPARGGAGASTFAAALARARTRQGPHPAVLVDLDEAAGGLDVLLGGEDQPGGRWPDLRVARGDVPARELVELLPRWGDVPVLSGDRTRREPIDPEVRTDVLRALASRASLVLDLPRPTPGGVWWAGDACDALVVVARKDLQSVAGALGTVARSRSAPVAPAVAVVVRGAAPAGLASAQISAALDCPVVAEMRSERALPAAVERGVGPCGVHLHRAALRVLEHTDRLAAARAADLLPAHPWSGRVAGAPAPTGILA